MARGSAVQDPEAQLRKPPHGSRTAFYANEVQRLIDDGHPVVKAAEIVAEANGVTPGNIMAARYRHSKAEGKVKTRGSHTSAPNGTAPTTPKGATVLPSDIGEILDSLKKDRESTVANLNRAIAWFEAQTATIQGEREKAYQDTIKKIRQAAGIGSDTAEWAASI